MKKIVSILLAISLSCSLLSTTVSAAEQREYAVPKTIPDSVLAEHPELKNEDLDVLADPGDYIAFVTWGMDYLDGELVFDGSVLCAQEVTKVGFKDVAIWKWNGKKWVEYEPFSSYSESNAISCDKEWYIACDEPGEYIAKATVYAQMGSGIFADVESFTVESDPVTID